MPRATNPAFILASKKEYDLGSVNGVGPAEDSPFLTMIALGYSCL